MRIVLFSLLTVAGAILIARALRPAPPASVTHPRVVDWDQYCEDNTEDQTLSTPRRWACLLAAAALIAVALVLVLMP